MADKLIAPLLRPALDAKGVFESVWNAFFKTLTARFEIITRAGEIADSWPDGVTITGVAATGLVTISEHTRQYPSGAETVQAGSVSGLTYGATGYLYYDDAVREGGIVSYAAATSYADAFAKAATPNRHFIGKVVMPANAGASNTTGTPAKPPGYV